MAVPKRRTSSARRDRRRAHHKLDPIAVVECPHCKAPVMPHRACKACGHYDGNKVMRTREEIKSERA